MTERETTVAEMLETMVDEQTKLITSGNDTETKELKVLLDGCRIFEEFKGALTEQKDLGTFMGLCPAWSKELDYKGDMI